MTAPQDEIRFARPGETEVVIEILREALRWMTEAGKKIWEDGHIDPKVLQAMAARDEIILALEAGEPVGTILIQDADPEVWPEAEPGEAFYLHRMGVRRAASGRGWGKRIISWATDYAESAGVSAVRLDCVPRPQLMSMYTAVGFSVADTCLVLRRGYTVVRMQKVFAEN